MPTVGSLPASFKTALQDPIGDVTDTTSIFYTVYGPDVLLPSSVFQLRLEDPETLPDQRRRII